MDIMLCGYWNDKYESKDSIYNKSFLKQTSEIYVHCDCTSIKYKYYAIWKSMGHR